MRFGTAGANTIGTLHLGTRYQFCVWVKLVAGFVPTSFSLDIGDCATKRHVTDEYGTILKEIGSEYTIAHLDTTNWTRVCVSAKLTINDNYNFIDLGASYGSTT